MKAVRVSGLTQAAVDGSWSAVEAAKEKERFRKTNIDEWDLGTDSLDGYKVMHCKDIRKRFHV